MQQFNIAGAKSHFSELVKIAMLGEDVVIAKGNRPLLRLVPIAPNEKRTQARYGKRADSLHCIRF